MTKVKLAEATKEINQQAGTILEEAARIRRSLEGVLGALRKQEAKFQREEEEEKARKRQEEQAELAKQHTKAWTMPDEDEPAPADAESDRSEEKAAAEAAAVKPSEPVKEKKEEKQQAEPAAKPQNETEKPAEAPAAKAEAPKQEAPKQETPKQEASAETAKPWKPNRLPRPLPVPWPLRVSVPLVQGGAARPWAFRSRASPGPRASMPVPSARRASSPMAALWVSGQYGRPANAAQGQGAGPRPAGAPYARPAGGAPYGRPAGAQGQPFNRPAGAQASPSIGLLAPRVSPLTVPALPRRAPSRWRARPQGGGARPAGGRSRGPELTPVVEKGTGQQLRSQQEAVYPSARSGACGEEPQAIAEGSLPGYDDETVRGGKKARSSKKQLPPSR
jgi:hypothetical protein